MKYRPRTKPMKHQTAALRACRNAPPVPSAEDVFAYLMDMGTGKSKVVCDEWGEMTMSGGPQDLLIIAPAGCVRNWYEDKSDLQLSEINAHLDPVLRERILVHGWRGGNTQGERNEIKEFMKNRGDVPRALFVNVEALSSVERAQDLCTDFVAQRLAYVAVDESTVIKGKRRGPRARSGSRRSDFVVRLGEDAAVRRIMTGLLTPKGPLDAFTQFEFLDWRIIGCRSWYEARARYAITKKMDSGGRTFDVIVGYQNLDDLQDRIKPYSYRVLKKDCLDLKPKVYVTRDVQHTPEQARVYRDLRNEASAQIPGSNAFVSTEHAMTLVMRLHQVNCGFVVDEEGIEHNIPSNRVSAVVDWVGEHAGKAIIWCPFHNLLRKVVAALIEEYGPEAVAQFHGANKNTRGEDERRFLGDPACRFMAATQGAGMRGNTWTVADLEIFAANEYDLEKREQSEDRPHRKGQTMRVTVGDLITPGTVDVKIVRNLRKKIGMASAITGEEAREWLLCS